MVWVPRRGGKINERLMIINIIQCWAPDCGDTNRGKHYDKHLTHHPTHSALKVVAL